MIENRGKRKKAKGQICRVRTAHHQSARFPSRSLGTRECKDEKFYDHMQHQP